MTRNRTTTRVMEEMVFGNGLFDRAVLALGMSRSAASHLIVELLGTVKADPKTMTIAEFTRVLPELGRRLRLLLPDDKAERALEKLRTLVVQWTE